MNAEESYKIIAESKPILHFCERFDETSPTWNFNRHAHPYIELLYFIDGKGSISVQEEHLSISLFDTVVYPANHEHQENATAERKREVICFWVDVPELVLPVSMHLHDRNNQLGEIFRLIYREAKREIPEPHILDYALKLLLCYVVREHYATNTSGVLLDRVVQYIHTHYAEKITLDELASLEHISKSYLSRQFKRLTGDTIVTYVNKYRIETAKHLLTTASASINDVAYAVGFESPKYFYRAFKAQTGESPASFRRRYQ